MWGLFEGNSKAPAVGVTERQLCLQTGLGASPVGVGASQWAPPDQSWPTLLLQPISRRFLEPMFDSPASFPLKRPASSATASRFGLGNAPLLRHNYSVHMTNKMGFFFYRNGYKCQTRRCETCSKGDSLNNPEFMRCHNAQA